MPRSEVARKCQDARGRARLFMETLLEQMEQRLPENLLAFQQLKFLKPTNVLQNLQPRFNRIPYLEKAVVPVEELSVMEEQLRQLSAVNWAHQFPDQVKNYTKIY